MSRQNSNPQTRNNKADIIKKYRNLVPASLTDAALIELIRRCDNSDSTISGEIQLLWDKETEKQQAEDEFRVVGKKTKKKEVTTKTDRTSGRDRSSRGFGRNVADRPSKAGSSAMGGQESKQDNAAESSKRVQKADPLQPVVHNVKNSGNSRGSTGDAVATADADIAVAPNSVWVGGHSLAQKLKTAEKMKSEPPKTEKEIGAREEDAIESVENTSGGAAKATSKSRSRREKKTAGSKNKPDASRCSDTDMVPDKGNNGAGEKLEHPVVGTSSVSTHSVEQVSVATEKLEEGVAVQPGNKEETTVPTPVNEVTNKFVKLGKWATSDEPAGDSSFQFGSFGNNSNSPVRNESSRRNMKSPVKNATWKASDNGKKERNITANDGNDSHRRSSDSDSWDKNHTAIPLSQNSSTDFENAASNFTGGKANGNQTTDTGVLSHVPVTAPPGLEAAQGLENAKLSSASPVSSQANASTSQRGNSRKSGVDAENSTNKQQNQPPPPGINQRAHGNSAGFGGIIPGTMIPNMPYGTVPYDVGHQAPSLHHNMSYGIVQPNFSGAAATLNNTQATSSSAPSGSASSGSSGTSGQQSSGQVTTGTATTQHQGAYQTPPPGMPAYMPYSYNPPYYGHQFYYGGQPQGYYGRGQPMYQQPPRNIYGGDGYGSGAPGAYPDVYGNQPGQYGDSQYGTVHHHGQSGHGNTGGSERGNKQKNSSSNSSSGQSQQSGNGASAESHPHAYPGYGGSYSGRDGQQTQYQYQGGWSPAPMMYPQNSPSGGFQGSGGRGQHESASKNSGMSGTYVLNGASGYAGTSASHYNSGSKAAAGGAGGSSAGNTSSSSGATSGSNLQTGGW